MKQPWDVSFPAGQKIWHDLNMGKWLPWIWALLRSLLLFKSKRKKRCSRSHASCRVSASGLKVDSSKHWRRRNLDIWLSKLSKCVMIFWVLWRRDWQFSLTGWLHIGYTMCSFFLFYAVSDDFYIYKLKASFPLCGLFCLWTVTQ